MVLGAMPAPGGRLQGKGAWVAERSEQLLFPGSLQTELNGAHWWDHTELKLGLYICQGSNFSQR